MSLLRADRLACRPEKSLENLRKDYPGGAADIVLPSLLRHIGELLKAPGEGDDRITVMAPSFL